MEAANRLIIKFAEVIVNPAIIVMFAVAFLVFLWGLAEYLRNSSQAGGKNDGKDHIIWGLVGMVIMVSAFAIIRILLSTFGIDVPDTIETKTISYLIR